MRRKERGERTERRPPYGEARSSGARGAGELLSCLAGSSSSESHRGSSSRGEQSEGSSEGSRFSSGGSQSDAIAVGSGAEAEPYRACEQSEGRSESANRAEHENREREGRRAGGLAASLERSSEARGLRGADVASVSYREREGEGADQVACLRASGREGREGAELEERLTRASINDKERSASHEKRSERARREASSPMPTQQSCCARLMPETIGDIERKIRASRSS
jgi:hypothetical protein